MRTWDTLASRNKLRLETFIAKEKEGYQNIQARGRIAASEAEREAAQREEDNKERVKLENKIIEEMAEEKAAHPDDDVPVMRAQTYP